MSAGGFHLETLRRLAAMPFLDRLELAAVFGVPDRSVYNVVAALESARALSPPSPTPPPCCAGPAATSSPMLDCAAWPTSEGITLEQVMRRHPVSARWRRILLERLDAVAVIYRLTSSIAAVDGNRLLPVVPGIAPGRRNRAE